jgi:hypothetical protein
VIITSRHFQYTGIHGKLSLLARLSLGSRRAGRW